MTAADPLQILAIFSGIGTVADVNESTYMKRDIFI